MKADKISLFFFIDAFGWEMLQENSFLGHIARFRYPLESVFGYSSACVPAILTGLPPAKNGFWSSFYYAPERSPFKNLGFLKLFPKFITSYHRVRFYISKWLQKKYGWKGYFSLYNFPFDKLRYFDYEEKSNFYEPGSIAPIKTIFDKWVESSVPYFSFTLGMEEAEQIPLLTKAIEDRSIKASYVAFTKIDGLLHVNDRGSEKVRTQLRNYEQSIKSLYELAKKHYQEVNISVFSDHDMTPLFKEHDLIADIEGLKLEYGQDYVAIYDSTMARFWFFNEQARKAVIECLSGQSQGRIISEDELRGYETFFPEHKYGELIFIMEEGTIINPSFMGKKLIAGMHGFLPSTKHAKAMLITNQEPARKPAKILDIFQIMVNQTVG